MAEIKSTLELVMERAAKMTANSSTVATDEDTQKEGMRLAAEYLNGDLADLSDKLAATDPKKQKDIITGAAKTILRNIVLPRDEMLRERSDRALQGITAIATITGAGGSSTILGELQQILQQYNQHKEQVTKQLEDALKGQLEQQLAAQGQRAGKVSAAMHPHYHEEMAKMLQDLNGQYNQAMEQRKQAILQQMGLS